MTKVAINGLGRIGRATLKLALEEPQFEVVAVNDLSATADLAYLLRYDSVYGRYERQVSVDVEDLYIDGTRLPTSHEPEPLRLPREALVWTWRSNAPAS